MDTARFATLPGSLSEDLVRSALALDASRRQLDEALAVHDPIAVTREALLPAMARIETLWMRGDCSIATEHLASGTFRARLQSVLETENARHASATPLAITA